MNRNGRNRNQPMAPLFSKNFNSLQMDQNGRLREKRYAVRDNNFSDGRTIMRVQQSMFGRNSSFKFLAANQADHLASSCYRWKADGSLDRESTIYPALPNYINPRNKKQRGNVTRNVYNNRIARWTKREIYQMDFANGYDQELDRVVYLYEAGKFELTLGNEPEANDYDVILSLYLTIPDDILHDEEAELNWRAEMLETEDSADANVKVAYFFSTLGIPC